MTYAELGLITVTIGSAVYALSREKFKRASKLPLPPSPTGSYPFIGHVLVQPRSDKHHVYSRWSKELNSDIISLTSLGQTIIILNSAEIATELMDRRGAIYSDRPQLRVLTDPDLLDWSYGTGSTPYGPRWKKQRRITNDVLKTPTNPHHFALIERETRAMLKRLCGTPDNFEREFRRTVATEILSTAYGYHVTGEDDPLVRDIRTVIGNFGRAVDPTNFLVNLIPWLKHVPEWFPGAGWKQTIKQWRKQRDEILHQPFNWAKAQIAAGIATPSMVKTHLTEIANNPGLDPVAEEDYLRWAAMTLFSGRVQAPSLMSASYLTGATAASDTTVSASMTFLVAMLQYPEIQARAQQEIDSVTHTKRLPEIADKDLMPFVLRIVQEVLRWQPVLPLGFPHASSRDDEYQGFFIPKGSIIMSNVWAMTRNESVYKNPEIFDPDRFLDPLVPSAPAFGFGRRSCPGNQYAEASLFITFASLLSVFNIQPSLDPVTGQKLVPEAKMTTNTAFSHPLPFTCIIQPRSNLHRELIDAS